MKKETFTEKARRKLNETFFAKKGKLKEATLPTEKEKNLFGGTLGVGVSRINKRRKTLEESLKY
ncbi:hypothetical protein KA005_18395 [bacterium]|nr:hypothetical protein [bacterium]